MALRTGYLMPMVSATGAPGDDMSKSFGGQVPLILDLGFKPSPNVFLGGYLGLGFGGTGDGVRCDTSCVAASFRIGLEVQYHFAPAESVNPWIGYGIGIESAAVGDSNNNSVAVAGVEWGHFMAGLDFRVSKSVGIGPLVDFSVGQYSHEEVKYNGLDQQGDISNTATHEWLLIGGRLVIFP
jgi:hypothetical protein